MSTTDPSHDPAFEPVGTGQNVFTANAAVTGRAKWLDTPADVIAFVENEPHPEEVIVIARGGTTTFLSVALNVGVKGVVTLQGAPESHLGILSREYGIPCVMAVAFEKGVRTSRGEVIPADGVQIRLDVTTRPTATVSVEGGAPVSDEPVAAAAAGPSPEEMAQIMALLEAFRCEIPHGSEGHEVMAAQMTTGVLETTDDADATKILSVQETNELLTYFTWNEWDALAARATEGESGLIPRQEYEALGILNSWFKHPDWLAVIREHVGDEGLLKIGAIAKNEFGTKVNLLHIWALATATFFGRGIAIELGLIDEYDRTERGVASMSAVRAMYHGLWGGGPILTSARHYTGEVLDPAIIASMVQDLQVLDTPAKRSSFQKVNGAAEMLAFLVHFDNRLGLGDTGPYRLEDGSRLIVRDLFLNEPAYEWCSHCEGLPYALTIAMRFPADAEIDLKLIDLSTLFSEPANYLPFVDAVAIYRREHWDTPMSEVQKVSFAEMDALRDQAEASSSTLYRHIAAMSHHDKIMAGTKTYTAGFALPIARAAGLYDVLVEDHGFYALDPDAEEALQQIGSVAAEMVPRLFLTGTWGVPIPAEARSEQDHSDEYAATHALAIRGLADAAGVAASAGLDEAHATELLDGLVAAGHARTREGRVSGYQLTPSGRTRHAAGQRKERRSVDAAGLAGAYDAFLPINADFKQVANDAQLGVGRDEIASRLDDVHDRVRAPLADATSAAPRFGTYAGRLDSAIGRYRDGDDGALSQPMTESYHDVWMELHEDLLTTLGRERSADDGS